MSSLWQEAGQPELALSVVIPIFNEAGNIERLYKELTAA
ncbi:MAG: glycosyl transferase, partial [Chloroflexi bacterium]|nr:glycosyl transferase [Chloroflexota bacterium]